MLSALLAVLALAGAPTSTHVECGYVPPASAPQALGETFSTSAAVVSGQLVLGPLNYIELGQLACGGLLYASESASERLLTRSLNPGIDFDQLVGVGLQVALHESEHVALNSPNECLVEKAARAKVNGLISQLGDPGRVAQEEAAATASDALLPASYHGC